MDGNTPTSADQSYPDDNPKTALGQAKPGMSDVPPVALLALGEVMRFGAGKYGHFNWRQKRVSATVYYDAAMRHLMAYLEGEDLDPESGLPHLAHVMGCMTILLDATDKGTLNDNRNPAGLPLPP